MSEPRVLIANRGEIAVRVIRACREMGIPTVAVYSDADRDALHVEMADRAERIGPPVASESYLNVEAILAAAKKNNATMVHPGYGFLAENAAFARACAEAGLTFIGPPPEAMEKMGDKVAARRVVEEVGVPTVPGVSEPVDASQAPATAEKVGFPIAVKAAHGGGGRGMHVVHSPEELEEAVERSAREAQTYFGRPEVYLERYIARAHHVEAQILADTRGNFSFLGERDCSLQRRYQKLVEESPSPIVDSELRSRIGEAALAVAKAAGYVNAGTVEFLLDEDGSFYFLEVNARLQVEHPVTEMVTGLDLVRLQIEVAGGEKVDLSPDLNGHAIECRINAEDPEKNFLPKPGLITALQLPAGPFVRVDAGVTAGREVPREYDSLIAKLVVWGQDRETATRRMLRALEEFVVEGPATTIPFHRWVLQQQAFIDGTHHTRWVESEIEAGRMELPEATKASHASALLAGTDAVAQVVVEVEGRRIPARVWGAELPTAPRPPESSSTAHGGVAGAVTAPMQGTILKVLVETGQTIEAGDVVCILEAMKMENHIASTSSGKITGVAIKAGDVVEGGQALVTIE
ncbi:MAG: acetyl/propionyl/methylcrotonyl-CoA carboxylase subunit alpha [Actinomycetota bacterium]